MSSSYDQVSFEGVGVGEVPGLIYVADWVTADAGESLRSFIDGSVWSSELRRRVQHYGQRYDYGRRRVAGDSAGALAPPVPTWARELAVRLVDEGIMDREADQVIVNEYLPGQGISAHVDCVPCFGPVVAAISLGSACVMDFTCVEERTKVAVALAPRSLCVMTGPARYEWRHAIAARKSDPGPAARIVRGRRLSITFRTLTTPAGD